MKQIFSNDRPWLVVVWGPWQHHSYCYYCQALSWIVRCLTTYIIEKSMDIWRYTVCCSLYDDDWCCRIKFLTSTWYASKYLEVYLEYTVRNQMKITVHTKSSPYDEIMNLNVLSNPSWTGGIRGMLCYAYISHEYNNMCTLEIEVKLFTNAVLHTAI